MVLPFLALGAMAVGGVVSAIGAKKQAEETNRGIEKATKVPLEVRANPKQLVKDAQEAGFNPLTVLRAGGLSQYTTTTGHNAHLYAQRQSPGGAFLSGIGNMISNVASAGLQNYQHNQSLKAAYSALPAFGAGGFGQGGGSGPAYGAAGRLGVSSHDRWTEEIPGVTNPFSWDWWESHPGASDIETGAEARYGDVGGAAFFPMTLGMDIGWNAARGVHHLTGWDPRSIGQSLQSVNWSELWGSQEQSIPSITVYGNPQ